MKRYFLILTLVCGGCGGLASPPEEVNQTDATTTTDSLFDAAQEEQTIDACDSSSPTHYVCGSGL